MSTLRLDELDAWLRSLGFVWESTRGSHRRYRHTETRYAVTVAVHGNKVEPDDLRWLRKHLEQHGATEPRASAMVAKRRTSSEGK